MVVVVVVVVVAVALAIPIAIALAITTAGATAVATAIAIAIGIEITIWLRHHSANASVFEQAATALKSHSHASPPAQVARQTRRPMQMSAEYTAANYCCTLAMRPPQG